MADVAPSAAGEPRFPGLKVWLPRVLLLGVIWGIAVFFWSTFGAWTHGQAVDAERRLAEQLVPDTAAWLEQALTPLERLAGDMRLVNGLDLPAGVESLPVQRVLYEYAYTTGQSEVYVVDLMRDKVGRTAGAAPLPAPLLERLAGLETGGRGIVGIGQRSGQMLLLMPVKVPLPNRVVVAVPVNLSALASGQPTHRLPGERKPGLVVPHANGWGLWRDGEQGFVLDEVLGKAMEAGDLNVETDETLTVLVPVPELAGVAVSVQSPNHFKGAALLPQLLVGLWAVLMSIWVLWGALEATRAKVVKAAAPVLAPLGGLAGKVAAPLGGAVHKFTQAFVAHWRNAGDKPLVSGPGSFGVEDFEMGAARRGPAKRAKGGGKAMKLGQDAAVKVERLKDKRAPLTPRAAAIAWPKDELKPDVKPLEHAIDIHDIEAVVEDALRKKRIRLLYQPIYRNGEILPIMHEVYARLLRGDGQVITPDVFLPIIAKKRMTLELDVVVLRRVVAEHFSGGSVPQTPLALNISSTSLDGIAYLQEMTAQGPRVLQHISFEVQSQEMIRDPKALRLLKDLQKHGGNLSVDYFGGGAAMLEASKAMGFNYVKLNSSRLMASDAGKKEIISLCQHARTIGLAVILEMVSDTAALEFGKRAGAEYMQGYELGRPREMLTTAPLLPS